tara:strand:+ start:75 stop:218 length:144 start_codon:yes stop_codon:yes gene_type:complete
VSTVDGIHEVVDGFVDTQGGIDILVNNAIFPDQARPCSRRTKRTGIA